MSSGQVPKLRSASGHRTRLVTIMSIIGVAVAGAAAVGANIGILDSVSNSSADQGLASDAAPLSSQVVDVYLPQPLKTSAQQFAIDVAGTVDVITTESGIALEKVAPTDGWQWSLTQNDPTSLVVSFTNGVSTLEFVAAKTLDGKISGSVNDVIMTPIAPPSGLTDCDFDADDLDPNDDDYLDELNDLIEDCEKGRDDDD